MVLNSSLGFFTKRILILIICFCSFFASAQEQINVMFYNLLRFPSLPPSNRVEILHDILSEYTPDLFMVCELQNLQASNSILTQALQPINPAFAKAEFVNNTSSSDNLQQMLYFNSEKLTLIDQYVYPTSLRDINHYVLRLNTVQSATDPIIIHAFVAHLKSSTGSSNEIKRVEMINVLIEQLANIPNNHHVVISGDFNLYNAYEQAYLNLINTTNSVVIVDPLDSFGYWHNNPDFSFAHTQSTRNIVTQEDGVGNSGATGGLDDRFDFIMLSESTTFSNPNLTFVQNSYRSIGNNGNCIDKRIDDPSCEGEYSLQLRRKLHQMSDHTPLMLTLQTQEPLLDIPSFTLNTTLYFTGKNVVTEQLGIGYTNYLNNINEPLVIYNMMGQKVQTILLQNNHSTIDVSNLSKGIYLITLQNQPTHTLKFIKQ